MVSAGWGGAMKRNTSRGRRGVGTARHYCSAEREVVGVLNVLRRGTRVRSLKAYELFSISNFLE